MTKPNEPVSERAELLTWLKDQADLCDTFSNTNPVYGEQASKFRAAAALLAADKPETSGERAAFENWAISVGFPIEKIQNSIDAAGGLLYLDNRTRAAWAWENSAHRAALLAADKAGREGVAWRFKHSKSHGWSNWRTDQTDRDRFKNEGWPIEYAYAGPQPSALPAVGGEGVEGREMTNQTEQQKRAELIAHMRTLANTLEALSADNDIEQNAATTLRKAAAMLAGRVPLGAPDDKARAAEAFRAEAIEAYWGPLADRGNLSSSQIAEALANYRGRG